MGCFLRGVPGFGTASTRNQIGTGATDPGLAIRRPDLQAGEEDPGDHQQEPDFQETDQFSAEEFP